MGETEIRYLDPDVPPHKAVSRGKIAVDVVVLCQVGQPRGDVQGHAHLGGRGDVVLWAPVLGATRAALLPTRGVAPEEIVEVPELHELEDHAERLLLHAHTKQLHDVWVVKAMHESGLVKELLLGLGLAPSLRIFTATVHWSFPGTTPMAVALTTSPK